MLGRNILGLDFSAQKVDLFSLLSYIYLMKYTFSNDVAKVFPRSSHRAIITNWTAIKPPNIYDDDEVEINSLYSVSLYMQEGDKMREERKEDEGHKKGKEREGKGYKKGKEREKRKWHKKSKEREESKGLEENKELERKELVGEVVGDEVVSDEVVSEEVVGGDAVSDDAVGDEVVGDEESKNGEKREESKGGMDGKDGQSNQKTSDDQESTHSTGSGAKNIETPSGSVPSLPLQGSTPGTRGKLTKAMAKKSLEIMTVEDPKESDIVIL